VEEFSNRLESAKTLFLDLRRQGYEFREALYKASQYYEVTASDLSRTIRSSRSKPFTPKFHGLFEQDYELINLLESEKEEPSYLY
jgi:hypothetical protein